MSKISYSTRFFDEMEEGNLSSARTIIPHVMRLVNPGSVIDIGCGEGLWLKVFSETGVAEIQGIDGDWVLPERLQFPSEFFSVMDLKQPVSLDKTYNLAVCLEVAEHLPDSVADTLIESLTRAAPIVLFSAAVPLQGGSHHVNEQWPAYWEEKFRALGYVPVDAIRRHVWDDSRVAFFYAQNILLYVKESELPHYPALKSEIETGHGKALPLIHPFIYTYYAERWRSIVPFLGKLPPGVLHAAKKYLSAFRRR